jgi:ABC-type bacteriocin/lantibiotic exporter with double-glycine peptidase domain
MPSASLNVPHCKQEFVYSCVPACARMVLAYFGSHHTEAELRALMRTDPNGTPVRRLTELTQLEFDVDFVTTDIAGLADYLTLGLPPIALLKTASLPYWPESCNHVAVVVGVDDSWVYLNDPYFDSAPQQVSHSDFLLAWSPYAGMVAIMRPRP